MSHETQLFREIFAVIKWDDVPKGQGQYLVPVVFVTKQGDAKSRRYLQGYKG